MRTFTSPQRRVRLGVAGAVGVLAATGACLAPAVAFGHGSSGPHRAGHVQPVVGPSRAQLVKPVCQTALDPPARVVSVTAVMRPLLGTQKLSVEFQLLERAAGTSGWTQLSAPGLGTWISPTNPPTLGQRPRDVWIVNKPVANLDAPASYRFSVSFRWTGAGGKVLNTTTVLGMVCHQIEQRPDLVVDSISVIPDRARPALASYAVAIRNVGNTGAGPFAVELSYPGATKVVDLQVGHIGAHRTVHLVFRAAPACSGSQPPTVTIDPAHQIDVSSRAQAQLAAQCPAAGSLGSSTTGASGSGSSS